VDCIDLGPASGKHPPIVGMSRGNSVLHNCVLHERDAMFRHLAVVHGANPHCKNEEGYTPILLATRICSGLMLHAAMDSVKHILWVFGPVSCVRYPLYEIESEFTGAFSRERSVLQVIDESAKSELLRNDVLWMLINDKWHCFAGMLFLWFAVINLLELIALGMALMSANEGETAANGRLPQSLGDAGFIVALAINVFSLGRLILTNKRLEKPWRHVATGVVCSLLPWLALPLRSQGLVYRVLLGCASALSWLRFMSDTFKFSEKLGPFVLMVSKMLIDNVSSFILMYICFFCMMLSLLYGFYRGMEADTDLWETSKVLFRFTINPDNSYFDMLEVDATGERIDSALTIFSNISQVCWILLAHVVLLNVLIAMMNKTYVDIHTAQELSWRLQFLQMVLFLEATPWMFTPPSNSVSTKARPEHHIKGRLDVRTTTGEPLSVECYFLQMERCASEKVDEKTELANIVTEKVLTGVQEKMNTLVADAMKEQLEIMRSELSIGLGGQGLPPPPGFRETASGTLQC